MTEDPKIGQHLVLEQGSQGVPPQTQTSKIDVSRFVKEFDPSKYEESKAIPRVSRFASSEWCQQKF